MYIGYVEITKREILFSAIIIAIMLGIGVWISNPILSSATKKALDVVTAVKVSDAEKFGYIKRTNVGQFYAEGTLIANDTITIPDIPGEYSYIEKVKEEHRMHVQTYTTTDGKGHTTVHTRTYWSWDVMDRKSFETESYTFLGERFVKKDIHYRPYGHLDTTIYNRQLWGNDIRYVYYTTPVDVDGVIVGVADNKSFSETEFRQGRKIEDIEARAERKINNAPIVFWILWSLLTISFVALFYICENKWLY
jgi:hypothetical protein